MYMLINQFTLYLGICGEAKLIDCGGVPYLVPTPQKEKVGLYLLSENCLS